MTIDSIQALYYGIAAVTTTAAVTTGVMYSLGMLGGNPNEKFAPHDEYIADHKEFLQKQTKELGNAIYRSNLSRDDRFIYNENGLILSVFSDCERTLYHMFQRGLKRHPKNRCLGYRPKDKEGNAGPYKWFTYEEVYARVQNFASGLRHLGMKKGDHLGIYSKNRVEWTLSAEACDAQSMVSIAIYDTFGIDAVVYVINHAEIHTIVFNNETAKNLDKIISKCPTIKIAINMDGTEDPINESIRKHTRVMSFAEVEALGRENPYEDVPPKPDDIAIIMYTSGTTGQPKGVLMEHFKIVAAISGFLCYAPQIRDTDVVLSYLPLAHILERDIEVALFAHGAAIGYYQGDNRKMMDDMKALQPTILPAVPRVVERIREGVTQQASKAGKAQFALFNLAVKQKMKATLRGENAPLWDRLVFSNIQQKTGTDKLRFIISGGSAMSPSTRLFVSSLFGCPIIQGYGLTETCAGGALSLWYDPTDMTSIGGPIASVEIKLNDEPEMGYFTTGERPAGELWIRGPSIFGGYYKDPEKTKEAINSEGWFMTGDIARYNRKNGTFEIIDRKKHFVKLQQGEYVSLEKIEDACARSRYVKQVYVYADMHNEKMVAVAVVDTDKVNKDKLNDPATVKMVLEDIQKTSKQQGLLPYEIIGAVTLTDEEFSVDNNLLTPSMKLKRTELKKKYDKDIARMFKELAAAKK